MPYEHQYENEETEQLIPSEKAFVTKLGKKRILIGNEDKLKEDEQSLKLKEEVKVESNKRFSTFVSSSFLSGNSATPLKQDNRLSTFTAKLLPQSSVFSPQTKKEVHFNRAKQSTPLSRANTGSNNELTKNITI